MPKPPQKLRKQYKNEDHDHITLRFEDGHEIEVPRGSAKSFDCYAGEKIKVLIVYDRKTGERELLKQRKADEFDDA